jgi:hypothetical protein
MTAKLKRGDVEISFEHKTDVGFEAKENTSIAIIFF